MMFYKRADKYKQAGRRDQKKYEHVAVAESALGKPLPIGAEIHHVNEDKSDNRPENLVICPSAKYHALLHMRMRAIAAGHPAHYRRCYVCSTYADPSEMYIKPNTPHARHRACKW
jgi:hypothetical protein